MSHDHELHQNLPEGIRICGISELLFNDCQSTLNMFFYVAMTTATNIYLLKMSFPV